MADGQKGDRIWLGLCTATGVVVDVTLNKYSAVLPGLVVLCLWGAPLVLFVIWFWRVERTSAWVKHRFLEHPVSYVLMFLILIPFGWQATATAVAKLRSAPVSRSAVIQQTKPSTEASQPATASTHLESKPSAPPLISVVIPPPNKKAVAAHNPNGKPTIQAPSPTTPALQPLIYGGQTCIGSACAQGPGSQATYNAAPKPVHIDMEEARLLAGAAKNYPDLASKISVAYEYGAEGGAQSLNNIRDAFHEQGIDIRTPIGSQIIGGCPSDEAPAGISLDCINDTNRPLANAIAEILMRDVTHAPIKAVRDTTGTATLGIIIRKP